jgi:hypothetical protein
MTEQELSYKLSLYLDGELPDGEKKDLEDYLALHPEAAKELRELRTMKQLLLSRVSLPVTIGFWTRLSVALDRLKAEEQNLLPFPRRFLPVVTAAGVVSMVVVGMILFQVKGSLFEYVSKKSEQVQQVYESSFLKGAIAPLLSNLSRDKVLQFALFGTLSLDEKSETALRVDETAEKGYRIEVGKPAEKKMPSLTVQQFYNEIKPTRSQEVVIDSVLRLATKQLESCVLVAENQVLAIDPGLPQLGRMTVSSIAASLEPVQRARFERLLHSRNAPYSVVSSTAKASHPEEVFGKMRRPNRSDRFVILTPDTLVMRQLELNIDSLREETLRGIPRMTMQFNFERFAQQLQRLPGGRHSVVVGSQPMRVQGDKHSFSFELNTNEKEVPELDRIIQMVRPRLPRPQIFFFRSKADGGEETLVTDTLEPFVRMDSMPGYAIVGKPKSYGPKLDSLMRRIDAAKDSTRVRRVLRERNQQEND